MPASTPPVNPFVVTSYSFDRQGPIKAQYLEQVYKLSHTALTVKSGDRVILSEQCSCTALYFQPGLLDGGALEHDCNLQRSIGYYLEALLALAPFMKNPVTAVLRDVTSDQEDPSLVMPGTTLYFQPGLLYGGPVEHDCNLQRSIGYYLEALLALAPFMKNPVTAVLRDVTSDQEDPSVDTLKATAISLMKRFGLDGEGLELKEESQKTTLVLGEHPTEKRLVLKGFSVRVSPQFANRIVDSARSIVNQFIPDIYIYTDHMKGANSGK
ncbi:UNVERIFIED_CONTAM: hypothetical protein FKN15_053949 [Acipenser sinensis]